MNRFWAHREPFSRGEKLLFAFLPVGILGFVMSGLWLARSDETPPIVFPTPVALPSPNGFDFYVAAARAITPAKPPVDAVDDSRALVATNPQMAARDYSLARRTAWLRSNSAGFALVKRGNATPSRFSPATGGGIYGPLRKLARAKTIEANTLILQKRWGDAAQSSLDTIQMGHDIARGGPLIAKLVGSAITAIGRDPLATSQLVPEKLSASQARAAARRLETMLANRPTYREALEQDKWRSLAEFMSLVQTNNWRTLMSQNNREATWRERISSQFLSARTIVGRLSDSYDQSIKDFQKPYNVVIAPAPPDPIISMFGIGADYRFSEGREIVPLDLLLLRFALRAYRLENGQFPAALNQLAPRYLRRIPSDYFGSGAPFRYRRNGSNYALWSVGPDKIDNGGAALKGRDGKSGANARGRFPLIEADSVGDCVAGKSR